MGSARAGGGRAAVALATVEHVLDAERDHLVLWTPVALGAGIAAWFLLPTSAAWIAFGCGALAIAALGPVLGGRAGRMALSGGLLVVAGILLAWGRAEMVRAPRFADERFAVTFDAAVIAVEDRSGREQWRLFLKPADPTLPPKVRVSLRDPPAGISPGATVRVRATLRPPPGPSIPGGYDFARRAWFQGLGAVGYALGPPALVRPAPPPEGLNARIEAARVSIAARLRALVPGAAGAIAVAYVTGDQGAIPEKVVEEWRDAGTAHLLSIGGLHIALVIGFTMLVARRLLTLSPWIALHWPVKTLGAGAGALAGVFYAMLAGAEIPILRAVLAALVVLAGIGAGRRAITLRTAALAAVAILIFRPEALIGPSFQLTFAAIVALIAAYGSPPGRRWFQPRGEEGFGVRWGRRLLSLVAAGVVAQAALAPAALFHFNREGVYGLASNLVSVPVTEFLVMPLLGLTLALDPLGLAAPAAAVLTWALDLTIVVAAEVAGWSGAVARAPTMPVAAFGLLTVGSLWLALWSTRLRLLGLLAIAAGAALAAAARPPDLVISPDGMHLGLVARDGRLAMLRPRAGSFIRGMWGDAAASDAVTAFDDLPNASCTRAACVLRLDRGGRSWRVYATRSRNWVDRPAMEAQCSAADIVVSDRRLPRWCTPRWLKLDAVALRGTGAVAIRLDDPARVATAAAGQGAHPWAVTPLGADARAR